MLPAAAVLDLVESTGISRQTDKANLGLTAVKSGDTSVGSTFPPGNACQMREKT
jgi:hypothetical protein